MRPCSHDVNALCSIAHIGRNTSKKVFKCIPQYTCHIAIGFNRPKIVYLQLLLICFTSGFFIFLYVYAHNIIIIYQKSAKSKYIGIHNLDTFVSDTKMKNIDCIRMSSSLVQCCFSLQKCFTCCSLFRYSK